MGFFDWIQSARKKPIEERRRIAALISIIVMAVVAFFWFIFFFAGLSERLATSAQEQATSTPQSTAPALSKPF